MVHLDLSAVVRRGLGTVVVAPLVLRPVGKLVDSALPRFCSVSVVLLDVLEASAEDRFALLPLLGTLHIRAAGLADVVLEGVLLQLVPLRESVNSGDQETDCDKNTHSRFSTQTFIDR